MGGEQLPVLGSLVNSKPGRSSSQSGKEEVDRVGDQDSGSEIGEEVRIEDGWGGGKMWERLRRVGE